jgi:hypothetical protein
MAEWTTVGIDNQIISNRVPNETDLANCKPFTTWLVRGKDEGIASIYYKNKHKGAWKWFRYELYKEPKPKKVNMKKTSFGFWA